ncbi:hypothetical protein ABZ297_30715 [Nonomuraea sp. NPDC005983]|uniref:hypothetical protein n=1 Tax=Nonomuraea sp. NPDC005983 TaxID=3155595 RepID=UPI0033AC27D1
MTSLSTGQAGQAPSPDAQTDSPGDHRDTAGSPKTPKAVSAPEEADAPEAVSSPRLVDAPETVNTPSARRIEHHPTPTSSRASENPTPAPEPVAPVQPPHPKATADTPPARLSPDPCATMRDFRRDYCYRFLDDLTR